MSRRAFREVETRVEHLSKSYLHNGGLAQLGERLLCKQEVNGSIPLISTSGESPRTIRGQDLL